jgi:hypothetical protein
MKPSATCSDIKSVGKGRNSFEWVALVLQGGMPLVPNQASVYEALAEANVPRPTDKEGVFTFDLEREARNGE